MDSSSAFCCAVCGAPCRSSPALTRTSPASSHARKPAWLRQPCACACCGVIVYCCEAHRQVHSQLPGDGGGHDTRECNRMADQLQRGARLVASLPFPWARGLCRLAGLGSRAGNHHVPGLTPAVTCVHNQLRPAEAIAASQEAAGEDRTPAAWSDFLGTRSSACEVLAAACELHGHVEYSTRTWPSGSSGRSSSEGGASAPGDASSVHTTPTSAWTPSAGVKCRAEGVWRRICSCRPAADLPPWGLCQLPQLASLRLARASSKAGQGIRESWDHASWAHKVWRLPADFTPPLERSSTIAPAGDAPAAAGTRQAGVAALAHDAEHTEPAPTSGEADAWYPPSQPSKCPSAGVLDWGRYYQWACLPLASPAALLLHFPLTLLRALSVADARTGGLVLGGGQCSSSGSGSYGEELQDPEQPLKKAADGRVDVGQGGRAAKRPRLLASQGQGHGQEQPQQPTEQDGHCSAAPSGSRCLPGGAAAAAATARRVVDVLYLGPQAELDCLDCFAALLPLLPRACTLRVRMIGPDVPHDWHGAELTYDSSSICGTRITGTDMGRAAAEAAKDLADSKRESSEGEGQRATQPGSTRIELSFWSCSLHEASESLLRDCLSAPAPQPAAPPSVLQPAPSFISAPPTQSQPPAAGDAGACREPVPGAIHGSSAASPAAAPPLVVLAPNAGLPAYMSWLPSLELLVAASRPTMAATTRGQAEVGAGADYGGGGGDTPGVVGWRKRLAAILGCPSADDGGSVACMGGGMRRSVCCLFTAYNEEEVLRSEQLLSQLYGVVPDVTCCENPFRQPLWCVERAGNALPSFSNGFLFGWCGDGRGVDW